MVIGVPKEIKPGERRCAVTPAGVQQLVANGHTVLVEAAAGEGSGLPDAQLRSAGAEVCTGPEAIFERADMVMKVKEPLKPEFPLLREKQILFTYLHLAASRALTLERRKRKVRAVAYETIRTDQGTHPLLTPMSEVAGRMSVQEGAKYLERPMEGRGILLGGVPGVHPGEVVVIGGGIVGAYAARVAAGLGAMVTLLEVNPDRLRYLADVMPPNVVLLKSSPMAIRDYAPKADLLVGAVLIVGARAPVLVRKDVVRTMRPGSVIVDVSIDQGGCIETSRPTTHQNPVFVQDGVIHYCVTNMPGIVARTSTFALTNVTLPYVLAIAQKGIRDAVREDPALARGVNLYHGAITHPGVAEAANTDYEDVLALLA